jgi:hypothetical protein
VRRFWPLLFPVTYLAHIAEEYFGGFPVWASHFLRFHLRVEDFLLLNTIAWLLMLCCSIISTRYRLIWLMVPFAAAVFINGCAHTIASMITLSYSPGLVTGLMLWLPLGAITLRRSYRVLSHKIFWSGVGVGVLLHLTVTLNAIIG